MKKLISSKRVIICLVACCTKLGGGGSVEFQEISVLIPKKVIGNSEGRGEPKTIF